MRRDAESHADEDKNKKELADARNEADTDHLADRKADEGATATRCPTATRPRSTSAIEKVKQAASGTDVNAIRQALNNLQSAAHAMAQHLQHQGGGPAPRRQAAARPAATARARTT